MFEALSEMDESPTQMRRFDPQFLHDAFNSSPIGIVVEDLEGQPLFANPAFCTFLGFSQEELSNKHCVDFSPPEDAAKDWALFQQLRAGSIDHYQMEKRYFRKDGSLVWGSLTISLFGAIPPSSLVLAMVEDITEKKRIEEIQFLHAAIVETSEDAILSVTLDGVIASWNPGAQRLFGYTESEVVGKSVTIIVPPELPTEEDKILETIRAGGSIREFETVRITKTGQRIDVSLSISPIKDSNGRIVGGSGIERDITGQKLAEEALRASEERLRLAQQAARIGTFECNFRTGVNTWTPELEALYGLQPGGFGGTQTAFENLVHPDDRTRVIELNNQAVKTRLPTSGEWRVVWPDGSVHWIAGRWQVFIDESGKDPRMIGVNADITDQKRSEEALRQSEQRFRLAAEAGKMYSFEWDVPTDVVVRYPERVKVLGGSEPLSFSHEQFMKTVYPDDRPNFVATIAGLTPEKPLAEVTYRLQRSDGRLAWLRSSGLAFFDNERKLLRVIGMVADITELKRAEEAASGITRKLITALEQERSRIGRELHDDINQRLALLAAELEFLQIDPSQVQNRAQELRRRTVEISNDVQALSHELHSSKLEYLGVTGGIKSWCKDFSDRQKMEVDFRSDVSNILPPEIGLTLFRVLQEALHNVVKHSGVKHVEVQLQEESDEVQLIVSDLGRGFDLDGALKGKGLGLASMRERVRLINGTIHIDSKPRSGTKIHVRVPLVFQQASQRKSM